MPYAKYMNDGIFELRIQQSNNNARILYFFFKDGKIVLTNGFVKKTPARELVKAKMYKLNYEGRFAK